MSNKSNRAPQPPTAKDVSVTHTQEAPNAPDPSVVQVPGAFAKQGPEDNRNDGTWHNPDTNTRGAEPAVTNEVNAINELFSPEMIQKLIESGVKQQLERMGINAIDGAVANTKKRELPKVEFEFLKHYRNNVSPFLRVQELDMSADVPQLAPIPGRFMRFRNGHFYATTENQVKQLDWMMSSASHSADQKNTLGGNRAIYEDDGEKLFYCTAGCSKADFVTASETNYRKHMQVVHNVTIE